MSLINQMLQDLDARSVDGAHAAEIHGQVRAVPTRRGTPAALWIAVVLVIALAAAGTLLLRGRALPTVTPPIVAAPAAAIPVVTTPSAATAAAPTPAVAVSQSIGLAPEFSLKMAADLSMVPLPVLQNPAAENRARLVADADNAPTVAASAAPALSTAAASIKKVPAKSIKTAASKSADSTPAVVNKQPRELTPQQRAENEYRRAATLMQQAKMAEAIETLEQALALDPVHSAARQTLVALLLENKRPDDAVRKIQEGLNLDPNQPALAMILARQQVEKGELRPAVETLQRSLPYGAERPEYLAFLAALLQRQGNHKEAIERYVSALRKTPQNGVWWMGMGISLQAENRLKEAQAAFSRAKASNTLSAELLAFVEQKLSQLQQ